MYTGVDLDLIIAREKQRDWMRQVEQKRLIRLARAQSGARVNAVPRTWDRLACWLRPLRLGRDLNHSSRSVDYGLYLLNALAWMAAKE